LLRNQYPHSKALTLVQAKPYDSHFWRGSMKIKELVLSYGSFKIKDVTQIRFWEDTWVSNYRGLVPQILWATGYGPKF
jgi:hypothetical protein